MNDNEKQIIDTRCGYVAMVGRPNVGKSTLLNHILGQKVSIVTAKPQTTRNRILAIHNTPLAQIIFLDTPGFHSPRDSLGRYMIEEVESAIANADLCLFFIDVGEPKRGPGVTDREKSIAERLAESGKPILTLINKIDLVRDKKNLLPLLEATGKLPGVTEVIPISAKKGDGVEQVVEQLIHYLPESPKLYPEDMLSEQAERFFVAEMIREALTELTHRELPYRSAVVIDQFVEETERCVIHATIHVEKKSQRGIMIGSKGSMIKQIGQRAREAASGFLGCPVDLIIHVDVSAGWTRTPTNLKKMGYQ
jgi:GTP-binding protein Era